MKKTTLFSILILTICGLGIKNANAQKWDSLAGGILADGISVIGSYHGQIYAGGSLGFGSSNVMLAKWDGTSWTALMNNLSSSLTSVVAIAEYQGNLYAGGNFANINGDYSFHGFAELNGTSWATVGTGFAPGASISALAVYNGKLYAGGYFTNAGGVATNGIAAWDGISWHDVGGGLNVNGQVNSLKVYEGKLIVSGFFNQAGNVITYGIAQWNDTSWSKLGIGADTLNQVGGMEVYKNNLYALGAFTKAGVTAKNGMGMWDGSKWNNVPDSTGGGIGTRGCNFNSLCSYNGYLYAGGKYGVSVGPYFKTYGLVRWDGSNWDTIPSIMTAPSGNINIAAMAVWNNQLYAGGAFGAIDGLTTHCIARWTSAAPAPLLTVYTTQTNPTCANTCDGKAIVHVSGANVNYTYSWSQSQGNNDTATFLCAGAYTVNIKDALGDSASAVVYLQSPPPTVLSVGAIPAACHQSNGHASSFVLSGSGPFTYSWNTTPPQLTVNATGLAPGNYTVTVTDALGCLQKASIAVSDSCLFVWPGDANSDGKADNTDILAIGIAYGKTGTARSVTSNLWQGWQSTPWADTLSGGINYKFIDCNGDGTINSMDTTAVIQNYGLLHNHDPIFNPPFDVSLPNLYLQCVPDTIPANAYGKIQIKLGDASLPANNVYGLSFNLHFDPTQIDPASIRLNLNNSWMGTNGTDLIGIAHTAPGAGMTGIALTRINQLNANGNGMIGTLTFKTTSTLIGTMQTRSVSLSITDVKAISANQNLLNLNALNNTLLVEDPNLRLGVQNESLPTLEFTVSPNPFQESTTILRSGFNASVDYVLYDLIGKEVRRFRSSESMVTLHKENLPKGMYLLKLFSEDRLCGEKKLVID